MDDRPLLVVDFDGLLNPMPEGWFDFHSYKKPSAKDAIKFLIDATEFFRLAIYGPRSHMFGGIQSMQAAIIHWTEMQVNSDTMHDLMSVLDFPHEMPEDVAAAINSTGVFFGSKKDELSQDALDFIRVWQNRLAAQAGRVFSELSTGPVYTAESNSIPATATRGFNYADFTSANEEQK